MVEIGGMRSFQALRMMDAHPSKAVAKVVFSAFALLSATDNYSLWLENVQQFRLERVK